MNTTYASKINPQFSNAGVQDVTPDLSGVEKGFDVMIKENENELKALQNIAQDQAQIEFNRGAADLVDKYGTDFKGLDKALLKLENDLYGRIKPTEPVMAENLLRQHDAVRLRAVDAAHRKYISDNDAKLKANSKALLEGYQIAIPDDYADYLDNLTKPAERKDINIIEKWQNNIQQIDGLLNRRDMNGNYIFTDKQRKERASLQNYMLDGAKNYIDRYVTNDDEAGLKNYYQAHLLAPERYMDETGQDRATYDKVKKYAENQLKRMQVDAETLKFKQSVQDATGLFVEYTPQKMQELRDAKVLPNRVLDQIEKTNVKFNEIDPKEPVLATNLLNVVAMVNRWDAQPNAETTEQQSQALFEASLVLDEVADYALEYPMSDTDLQMSRRMVMEKARNQAYGEMMKTFGEVTQGFGMQINNVEESVNRLRAGEEPRVDWKPKTPWIDRWGRGAERALAETQVRQLTEAIRTAENATMQAIDEGNLEQIPRIQRALQVAAAHIKYMNNFSDSDWVSWEADKEHIFQDRVGGGMYRVKEITPKGDIITEIVK